METDEAGRVVSLLVHRLTARVEACACSREFGPFLRSRMWKDGDGRLCPACLDDITAMQEADRVLGKEVKVSG